VKKWVIILSLIIVATITYNTFSIESEFYVRSVPILRVYHHNQGFVVIYQTENIGAHRIYVPYRWFQVPQETGVSWRAEVVYGNSIEFPYMNIFWNRNGFSHMRLFLVNNKAHHSWGNLHNPTQFNDNFDIEVPDLRF